MVTISIPNMTCGGCAKGVLATLNTVSPGTEAKIDLAGRLVQVAVSDAASIVAALRADGWNAAAA